MGEKRLALYMCQILFFIFIPVCILWTVKSRFGGLCLSNPGFFPSLFCKSLYTLAMRVNFIYSFIYIAFLESDQLGEH